MEQDKKSVARLQHSSVSDRKLIYTKILPINWKMLYFINIALGWSDVLTEKYSALI